MSLEMGMTGGGSGGGGGAAGGVAAFCDVFVVLALGTCSKSVIFLALQITHAKTSQHYRNKLLRTFTLGAGHLENTNTDGTTLSLRRVVCPVKSKSSVLK